MEHSRSGRAAARDDVRAAASAHALERLISAANVSPRIALMRLLIDAETELAARAALDRAVVVATDVPAQLDRLREIRALWDASPRAYEIVRAIHRLTLEDDEALADARDGCLARQARLFDRAAAISAEASVALYSFGDPAQLAALTREVIERLDDWRLVRPDTRVLDLGCGTGRFLEALAPRTASVVGVDLSKTMVDIARARIGHLANARVIHGSGRDLASVPDRAVDLVLAADTFPYLVEARVVDRMVEECARVLDSGGHLAILNYSYRGDAPEDRRDAAELAERYGFEITRHGTSDLRLWDATTFLWRRR